MSLQPLYQEVAGHIGTALQFRMGQGAQIVESSGVLLFRNAANSAYCIGRCLNPVGNQDIATKDYVDSAASPAALKVVRFDFAWNSISMSTLSLPALCRIYNVILDIQTVFNNQNTLINVGSGLTPSLIMESNRNNPLLIGTYSVEQDTGWEAVPSVVVVEILNNNNGYPTSLVAGKLVDSMALFQTRPVKVGDTVRNITAATSTTVLSVDSEIQLTLNADIFLTLTAIAAGANTAVAANKLMDGGADFVAAGVAIDDVIYNTTDNTRTLVTNIDSAIQLEIEDDLFTATPENYAIVRTDHYDVAPNIQGAGYCSVFYSEPGV